MAQTRSDRTLGDVHDAFWGWCAQDELRLQHCATCEQISWPPVEACEYCGSSRLAWTAMSGHGRLIANCSFERDYYAGLLPIPWDAILVELAEGPLFVSNPQGFRAADAPPGAAVKLAFIACEDSHGVFRLPVFELA